MSIKLRPYQIDDYKNVAMAVRDHSRVIYCLATGGGKTKIAITMLRAAMAKGRTGLFITEADKIYQQLNDEIPESVNINASTNLAYIARGRLYLAMAQTLSRRPKLIAQFAAMGDNLLIINDEAHIGTATKLLKQLPDALLVGLTATPDMSVAKHLPTLYNHCVVGAQPDYLVAEKYLTPYKHFSHTAEGVETLKKGSNGDFTEDSQERVFDKADAQRFLLRDLRETPYRKAMIFCASINSAESMGRYLTDNGLNVCVQHSDYTRPSRNKGQQMLSLAYFKDLQSGVDICVSVGSMTKGFDFPPIDLIMLWRSTTSLPLYLQMCGRGSRLSDGKYFWTCHDYGGNGKRHNTWDYLHDWATMWNAIDKKKGVAPIKECPECSYLMASSLRICPNCGYQMPVTDKDIAPIDNVQTIELMVQQVLSFTGRRLSELDPIQLAQWGKARTKLSHAIRVAKALETTNAGYLKKFGQALGYKQGWAYIHCPKVGENIPFTDLVV